MDFRDELDEGIEQMPERNEREPEGEIQNIDHFSSLRQEVVNGLQGKNSGIPMGFDRLNDDVSIRSATYYLLGGYTGSGKTSLVDDAFVLNPLDALLKHPSNFDLDLHIIYFSMERRKNFKLAKWISRSIFLNEGVIIPINRLLGWVNKQYRLTPEEFSLFEQHEEYINALMEKIEIVEGPQTPTGMKIYVDNYAKKNGILDTSDKYHPKYYSNSPNTVVEVISDHVGLTSSEKGIPKGKPAIDEASAHKQRMRDLYGFSPIDVSQFNRDIASPMRIKNGDVEPMLEDFKETGSTQENADIVLSLFDPVRYKVPDPSGYDLNKLSFEGSKKYRNLKILKNSYGRDDIRIGLAFQPQIGLFKEMPRVKETTEFDYMDIQNNNYFLRNKK